MNNDYVQHVIVITGAPGSGKTTLSSMVAREMNKQCIPTAVVEQGMAEIYREGSRRICKAIQQSGDSPTMAARDAIMRTSRQEFLEGTAATACFHLKTGLSVIITANLRNSEGDKDLFRILFEASPMYATTPYVGITGIHIQSDHTGEENIQRLTKRLGGHQGCETWSLVENPDLREGVKQLAASLAVNGPGYPEYQHLVIYMKKDFASFAHELALYAKHGVPEGGVALPFETSLIIIPRKPDKRYDWKNSMIADLNLMD